jgi:hypothetical protein
VTTATAPGVFVIVAHHRGPLIGQHDVLQPPAGRVFVKSLRVLWPGLARADPAGHPQHRQLLRPTAGQLRHRRLESRIAHATQQPARQEAEQGLEALQGYRRGCHGGVSECACRWCIGPRWLTATARYASLQQPQGPDVHHPPHEL